MQKTRVWRAVSWIVGGGSAFLFLLFLLSLYLSGEGLGAGKIGLIHIEGVILDSKEVLQELEKHQRNHAIKALVVRINSPGGTVAAAQEIYEELNKIRSRQGKPVIVSMGGLAASGGYYIACASDRIFANPGTITGSIGVIMQLANISQLLEKVGIKSVVIKSGQHKDMGSFTKELSTEDQRIFQGVLDDAHDQFVEAVVKGRRIDKGRVREIADGRIFTGRQAKSLGLVDELGDLADAISYAAQRAGIKGTPKIVEQRRRKFSLLDLLGSKISPLSPASMELLRGGYFSVQYLME